jgi:dimeric dUTPase (all-alpha-NTP-PPase superfamily)
MNLSKLYEVQAKLKERIGYKGEDKFEKMMLALLVEVAECANEWRGFKYWSKDQKPRINVPVECGECINGFTDWPPHTDCEVCEGKGYVGFKNPLLEEYVDGLHFVLEIGLDLGFKFDKVNTFLKCENIVDQFLWIYRQSITLLDYFSDYNKRKYIRYRYVELIQLYLGLGEMLGFTWEEIEAAYMEKNKINHERQENGY